MTKQTEPVFGASSTMLILEDERTNTMVVCRDKFELERHLLNCIRKLPKGDNKRILQGSVNMFLDMGGFSGHDEEVWIHCNLVENVQLDILLLLHNSFLECKESDSWCPSVLRPVIKTYSTGQVPPSKDVSLFYSFWKAGKNSPYGREVYKERLRKMDRALSASQ